MDIRLAYPVMVFTIALFIGAMISILVLRFTSPQLFDWVLSFQHMDILIRISLSLLVMGVFSGSLCVLLVRGVYVLFRD